MRWWGVAALVLCACAVPIFGENARQPFRTQPDIERLQPIQHEPQVKNIERLQPLQDEPQETKHKHHPTKHHKHHPTHHHKKHHSTPAHNSSTPAYKSTVPHHKSTVPHHKSTVPHNKSTVPHNKSTVPHHKSTVPHNKSTVPHNKSTVPHNKSTVPHNKSTAPHHQSTAPAHKSSTTANPTTPAKATTTATPKKKKAGDTTQTLKDVEKYTETILEQLQTLQEESQKTTSVRLQTTSEPLRASKLKHLEDSNMKIAPNSLTTALPSAEELKDYVGRVAALIAEEVKGNVYEDDVANMINYAKKIEEIIDNKKPELIKYYRENHKEIESLTTKVKNSKTDLSTTITEQTNAADQKKLLVIVGSCLGVALLLAVVAGVVGVWWYRRKANTKAPQRSKMAGNANSAFAEENEFHRESYRHHARGRSPEAGVSRRQYSPEVRAPRHGYSEYRSSGQGERDYNRHEKAPSHEERYPALVSKRMHKGDPLPRQTVDQSMRSSHHENGEHPHQSRSAYYDYEDRSDSPEPKSWYQDKPSYNDKLSQDKPKALTKSQGYMAEQAVPTPKMHQVQNRFGHVQPTKHQFINPVNERREFRGPYGPDDI